MLIIGLAQEQFEYGIRALLMSFFPHQEFRIDSRPLDGLLPEEKKNRLQVMWDSEDLCQVTVWYFDAAGTACSETGEISKQPDLWQFSMPFFFTDPQKRAKRLLDRTIYRLLSKALGITLPWGTLTGIRPTKLPMAMLMQDMSSKDILHHLQQEYLISEEKAKLSLEIANREKQLLDRLDCEKGYSLYIGIPFCPSTCLYCSFTSYPLARWKDQVDSYLDALEREMQSVSEWFAGHRLNTVYVGGGTPTTLSPKQLERLCSMLEHYFDFSDLLEFTVEAGRPDSITEEKLQVLRQHPVDRISINPQTMKQETLKLIGRHHTVEQVREAYALARKLGFDNINMDLILGLPGETLEDVKSTLAEMQQLAPDNLTVHSLAVKRAAALNINWEQYSNLPMENTREIMDAVYDSTRRMGLEPYYLYRQKNMAGNYENVGYALPGKAGIYNILIMEEKQSIVALGAGASTKAVFENGRIERCENVKDVTQYIQRIDEMLDRKKRLFQI